MKAGRVACLDNKLIIMHMFAPSAHKQMRHHRAASLTLICKKLYFIFAARYVVKSVQIKILFTTSRRTAVLMQFRITVFIFEKKIEWVPRADLHKLLLDTSYLVWPASGPPPRQSSLKKKGRFIAPKHG
jgi:hypothetical protein